MAIEIKVPSLGESVTEATVARWLKQLGDAVALDEPVVELETDKVNVEVPAPAAGTLAEILAEEGMSLPVGAVLGRIGDSAGAAAETAPVAPHPSPLPARGERAGPAQREGERQQATQSWPPSRDGTDPSASGDSKATALERSGPAVRKLVAERGLDVAAITATGPGDRITKRDVIEALARPAPAPPTVSAPAPATSSPPPVVGEREVRLRMTRLRRRIAERLKAAQTPPRS